MNNFRMVAIVVAIVGITAAAFGFAMIGASHTALAKKGEAANHISSQGLASQGLAHQSSLCS
jgi:hypothetical protein